MGILLVAIAAAVVIVLVSSGSSAPKVAVLPPSIHRAGPETIFTPGAALKNDPNGTLQTLEKLGVTRVRVFLTWNEIAPDPTATREPAGFDASNPAAYPSANWVQYDTIIKAVESHHVGLDVVLGPPPPRWAAGKGAPKPALHTYWKPNAHDFQDFVHAVGTRYSGHYTPAGASKPLPRVAFWSIWNEPNIGVSLAPQAVDDNTVEESALLYRQLADAAWNGLQASGHGKDLTLVGETAPAGSHAAGAPGNFNAMAPLRFLRALYCVDADYRPLTGSAATARGCPATAPASAHFAADHPVLFKASAFSDHMYPQGLPPNVSTPNEPDYAELASVPELITALDRLQSTYGSRKHFEIYDTEFGYQTAPPDTQGGTVSPAVAAGYLNWSEYLHWRNPRIASYDQYLLLDPAPLANGRPYTAFATGLLTSQGAPKPTLAAFTMPLYLPVTRTAAGHPLEVWGCVRPETTAARTTHRPQFVEVQFRRGATGSFATVDRVRLPKAYCYFDVRTTFPGSGSVRLSWSYPHGPVIHSRIVGVTVG
ncbi:MAG: hypothetical protein WAU75_05595 [Solirubrobacteraceae bacterium]